MLSPNGYIVHFTWNRENSISPTTMKLVLNNCSTAAMTMNVYASHEYCLRLNLSCEDYNASWAFLFICLPIA